MSKKLTTVQAEFDYSSIDKGTTGKLRYLAGQVKAGTKSHIQAILDVGEQIAQANELLAKYGKEGLFGKWVEAECGISRMTAYNYLNAHERFGEHRKRITHFTAEAIYYLSRDDTTLDVIDEALSLNDKGVTVTKPMAEELAHLSKAFTNAPAVSKKPTHPSTPVDPPKPVPAWQPPAGVKQYKDTFGPGEHWSSPNGCHEDCPACAAEPEAPENAGVDVKPAFKTANELLGKLIRLADDIHDVKPHNTEHDALLRHLQEAIYSLDRWRKA